MSKKTKRQIRRDINPVQIKSPTDPLVGSRPTGFNPDYQFVARDIKRVGILAGSFVVILFVLSFFLH